MAEELKLYGGWVVAILVALFAAVTQWRKSAVDETGIVLAKWKEMTERHETDLKELREELRRERADNSSLRERLREAEDRLGALTTKIADIERERKDERAGFVTQITQLQKTLQAHGILSPLPANAPETGNRTSADILREIDDQS